MKKLMKGVLTAALALCMLVGGVSGNTQAVQAEETGSSGGVEIDKTASPLDENSYTTVKLSVGGTEDVENVAVLFVLDYSTSVNVRNAAGDFLTELAGKENTNLKAAVVDYSAVAESTEWTTIDSGTDTSGDTGLLASKTSSGTNYHAGLLKAQEMLASDKIAGYTTYLITISDGITYLWTDEETSGTMSVWVRSGATGEESLHNANEVYELKYGVGQKIGEDQFNALVSDSLTYGSVDLNSAYQNTLRIASEYPGTQPDPDTGTYVHADEYDQYLIGTEVAIYKTTSVYRELVNTVDYAFAFKMDEGNWTSFPYGEQLMNYLISVSDNGSGTISDTTAESVFSTIKDQILYEINSGTVTDIIGSDFNWVGMETVKLTVGVNELTGTVDGNTVTFDNGSYVVAYYPDSEDSSEYIIWEINVPVEATAHLELSYVLELNTASDTFVSTAGEQTTYTNESAVIEYEPTNPEDPENPTETETFPVPEVKYINITVIKNWLDGNNEDGLRPESVYINLSGGSGYPTSTAVKDDGDEDHNEWVYTYVGLQYCDENGNLYVYNVTENAVALNATYKLVASSVSEDGYTYSFSNAQRTDLSVTKVWDDSDDQDGIRPDSVTLNLLENGELLEAGVLVLSDSNSWTSGITGIVKYDTNGNEIEYTFTEDAVSGYTTTITGSVKDGFVITNSHTPETTTEDPSDPTEDTEDTTAPTDDPEDTTETTEETTTATAADPVATVSADTGDDSNLELYVVLIAICAVALIGLVTVEARRRKR